MSDSAIPSTSNATPEARFHPSLLAYMGRLRDLMRLNAPENRRRFPESHPCATCAFVPATDSWPGFEKTALALWHATMDGEPFYCHHGFAIGADGEYHPPDDPRRLELCWGWSEVAFDSRVKLAGLRLAWDLLDAHGADRKKIGITGARKIARMVWETIRDKGAHV